MGQCWVGENGVRTLLLLVCVCVVFACVLVLTLFCCIALELVNAVSLPSLPSPPLPSHRYLSNNTELDFFHEDALTSVPELQIL